MNFQHLIYFSLILHANSRTLDRSLNNPINSENDPYFELDMLTCLKKFAGIYAENYSVTTEDGFTLEIFRMRQIKPIGIIVLQHSYVFDSRVWFVGNNDSIALKFWLAGYDLWMPNYRGTKYGKKHVSLNSNQKEYWDFGIDELAIYDFPTIFDFIYEKVNKTKMIFVGQSLSASSIISYAALKPKDALNKFEVIIPAAPMIYSKYCDGTFRYLLLYHKYVKLASETLKIYNVLSQDTWYIRMVKAIVYYFPGRLFIYVVCSFSGWTPNEVNLLLMHPVLAAFTPTCLKVIYHFGQILYNGDFVMYDYGEEKNMLLYNQTTPLKYPLHNIEVPVYLFSSTSDFMSTAQDIQQVYNSLPQKAKKYGFYQTRNVGHVDYYLGIRRHELIWDKILQFLQENIVISN